MEPDKPRPFQKLFLTDLVSQLLHHTEVVARRSGSTDDHVLNEHVKRRDDLREEVLWRLIEGNTAKERILGLEGQLMIAKARVKELEKRLMDRLDEDERALATARMRLISQFRFPF